MHRRHGDQAGGTPTDADRIGEYPVLLLDEVVAELDSQRRAYLRQRIDGVTQTLVTTTELDIFTRPFSDRARIGASPTAASTSTRAKSPRRNSNLTP